ncbi:restriction endonuclease subunit S [Aliarcobacter butzleri]|uniref:restriction endonuclease subunit S n=1 Tax=Aliarcobacter butzleri TaxID=28197 RepID=UPI001EDBF777|nr:restriction endonuclease subunit S [Aliarcobacter butzleri]MCG3678031.1 restriction endonuclease subunit S [Aliarcobacter butzleri]
MIDNLPNGWRIKEYTKVFKDVTSGKKKIPTNDYLEKGNIAVIDQGQRYISGYTMIKEAENCDEPVIIFGDHTRALKYIDFNYAIGADGVKVLKNIEPNSSSKFLYYLLKNSHIPNTGYNRHFKYVKRLEFLIPPLQQQEKIVKVLDLTSNLIEKQKELLEKYDLFLKSKFIEMFGDPISNPMGWEVVKLGNYGTLARGKSAHRPRNAPFLYGGKYPFIQTGDITKKGSIYLRDFKQTYSEEGIKQSKLFSENTIAITIAANIGDAKVLSFDCYFPDSVVGFNVEIPLFVVYLLSFYKYKLEQESTQTAQKNINLQVLNNLDVIKPEIELQNKFASIVEKIETIKEKENQKLKQFEDLHNSMMNKAFKGEIK